MRTLLHVCCGPCATATVAFWRGEGLSLTGYFYNPNIHPLLEFRRRMTGAEDLAEHANMEIILDRHYDPVEWFTEVGARKEDRCRACIGLRLQKAAGEASALGWEAFTTTLAISPWQDHEAIKSQGAAAAEAHSIEFLYEDLRPKYRQSREMSRNLGLYRQKYCGCILSEWERYR